MRRDRQQRPRGELRRDGRRVGERGRRQAARERRGARPRLGHDPPRERAAERERERGDRGQQQLHGERPADRVRRRDEQREADAVRLVAPARSSAARGARARTGTSRGRPAPRTRRAGRRRGRRRSTRRSAGSAARRRRTASRRTRAARSSRHTPRTGASQTAAARRTRCMIARGVRDPVARRVEPHGAVDRVDRAVRRRAARSAARRRRARGSHSRHDLVDAERVDRQAAVAAEVHAQEVLVVDDRLPGEDLVRVRLRLRAADTCGRAARRARTPSCRGRPGGERERDADEPDDRDRVPDVRHDVDREVQRERRRAAGARPYARRRPRGARGLLCGMSTPPTIPASSSRASTIVMSPRVSPRKPKKPCSTRGSRSRRSRRRSRRPRRGSAR